MKANKPEAVEIARSVTKFSPEVESKEYDMLMPMKFTDGHFPPAPVKTIDYSMLEKGLLSRKARHVEALHRGLSAEVTRRFATSPRTSCASGAIRGPVTQIGVIGFACP